MLVSLLAHPKSAEPMVQQSLLANFAASLFLVPRDMRQRVAEFMNRSFHPNEEFVRRKASGEHIMADSRVTFVPPGMERDSTHGTGAGLRVRRCYSGYRTRISLTSLVTCRIFANRNPFSEPLQRLRCRVGSEGSDSPRREGTATVLSWESSTNRRVYRVAG